MAPVKGEGGGDKKERGGMEVEVMLSAGGAGGLVLAVVAVVRVAAHDVLFIRLYCIVLY